MIRFNQFDIELLNAQRDDSCEAAYPGTSAYLRGDGSYEESGVTFTFGADGQRIAHANGALANIRNTAVEKASVTSAPGLAARNCGVHAMCGNDNGLSDAKSVPALSAAAYSYYELFWNWKTATPPRLSAPQPPATPDPPVSDAVCDASIATGAS